MSLKDRVTGGVVGTQTDIALSMCTCANWMALNGGGVHLAGGTSKGDFSCCVRLVVRAAIQADRTLDFCGFCDGDRDMVDLNILQTAKK